MNTTGATLVDRFQAALNSVDNVRECPPPPYVQKNVSFAVPQPIAVTQPITATPPNQAPGIVPGLPMAPPPYSAPEAAAFEKGANSQSFHPKLFIGVLIGVGILFLLRRKYGSSLLTIFNKTKNEESMPNFPNSRFNARSPPRWSMEDENFRRWAAEEEAAQVEHDNFRKKLHMKKQQLRKPKQPVTRPRPPPLPQEIVEDDEEEDISPMLLEDAPEDPNFMTLQD